MAQASSMGLSIGSFNSVEAFVGQKQRSVLIFCTIRHILVYIVWVSAF
jgi:hypothetical protein